MTCASAWMEASLSDPDAGQRWVIYDEAWRMIRQPALLARMQSQWKLSRGLGIANLMVIHRLSDLDAVGGADSEARALAQGLLADCSTKILYQQETSEARTPQKSSASPSPNGHSCRICKWEKRCGASVSGPSSSAISLQSGNSSSSTPTYACFRQVRSSDEC